MTTAFPSVPSISGLKLFMESDSKQEITQPPLRIIGIGSPFGDDTLGFQAIERLRGETELFPADTELLALDRPGSTLIPLLENSQTVVIIDAMHSGLSAGTVQRLEVDDLLREKNMPSSHNLGVAESLALATVLGVMPEKLLVYGIEAGEGVEEGEWYPALRTLLSDDVFSRNTRKKSLI